MKPSDYPPAVRAVFDLFTDETGIAIRLVGCMQAQQATTFAGHFELWELRLVIRWLKARIVEAEGGQRNGFNRQSLKWENVFGSDGDMALPKFQSHLGIAMQWAKRFAPKLIGSQPATEAAQPAPAPTPAQPVDWSKASEEFRKQVQQTFLTQ